MFHSMQGMRGQAPGRWWAGGGPVVGRQIAENFIAHYRHVPRCWRVGKPRADVRGGVWAAAHPARGCRATHSLLVVWRQVVGCRLRLPHLVAVPATQASANTK